MRALTIVVLGLVLSTAPALAFDCTALTGTTVPKSAIGLPTSGATVKSASLVRDPQRGNYCKLIGAIKPVDPTAPDINFQVNLPEHWNGKAVQSGGGGFNGSLVTAERLGSLGIFPVKQGYVSFGSDSGHKGTGGDASFALNAEAFTNFKGAQLKKTRDTAVALVRRVLQAWPRRTYFVGGSEGGREALTVGERWPKDYDGIVAIYPAFDSVVLGVAFARAGQEAFGKPGAWVSPARLSHVSARVLEACDGLDGLKDGIIGNVKACRAAFDIASLRCGVDSSTDCLSEAQLAAVRALASPRKLGVTLSGLDTSAPWPILESDATTGTTVFGRSEDVSKSVAGVLGGGIVCFMAMQDANCDVMHFNPAAQADQLQKLSREGDVAGALEAFRKRAGKVILMAGSSDMTIPPGNTIAFYERLRAAYGAATPRFARFYMVPGQAHGGGGGNFLPELNVLGALDGWVTSGKPPDGLVVTDASKSTAGRTRPLCEYPAYPKYNGSGDVSQAANFTCAMP